MKCDGTRAETRFRRSAKRTSPFKSAVASVQSSTGSRAVRISGSNAGYTVFRGSVKSSGYPIHSPVSPSLAPPVRHHISNGVYVKITMSLFDGITRVCLCSIELQIQACYSRSVCFHGSLLNILQPAILVENT